MPRKSRPRIDVIRRAIGRNHVVINHERLVQVCQASSIRRMSPTILDTKFKTTDLATWKLILERSRIDEYRYRSNIKDCDNFAAALFGTIPLEYGVNGIGFVLDYSGRHAYNALLYFDDDPKDLEIALVEPQSDEFVATGDRLSSHEAYKAQRGEVIWG